MLTEPILICDGLNTFMRSYCAYPAMAPNGEHIGGVVGFVKTLRRVIDLVQPKKVFVVWEGGGSSRRRSLYSEYKRQRKPGKLNRFYEDDLPDNDDNKLRQVSQLVKLLKPMPICQLYVGDVEADDVIAYLTNRLFKEQNKIILSTDKDMYQLLDERTHTYDLNKKDFVTPESVMTTFHIPPRNFALAKTICGDGSDNIPGIKGVGFKTAAKKFPILQQDQDIFLQDVINYAATRVDESPVYKNVARAGDDLRRNWRLVYLDGSMLSAGSASKLENVVNGFKPTVNKIGVIKAVVECGANGHLDIDGTLYSMNHLTIVEPKTQVQQNV